MSTAQDVNYIDVIKNIEDFYADSSISVQTITSTGTKKYRPLTVEQLKRFIELQISATKDEFGVLPGLEAVTQLNKIIIDNNIESNDVSVLSEFTVLDRDAILLQLRANTKSELEITGENEGDTVSVNLDDVVSRLKTAKLPKNLIERTKTIKYKSGTFKVKLNLPNLTIDQQINGTFKKMVMPTLNKGAKHVEKTVDKVLSTVYFLEIYKYISSITIEPKEGEPTVVNFRNMKNFGENYKLLDKLPTQVVTEISGYMTDVREFRETIFYYENDDNKQLPIEIDVALFTGI